MLLVRQSSSHRSFSGPLGRLLTMFAVARSRRALARLDADGLADVGLTRAAALNEARRAPWDVPQAWARLE